MNVKGGGPLMPSVRNCPDTATGFNARSSDFRQFCSLGMGFTLLPQSGFCPGLSATVRNDRNVGLSTYRRSHPSRFTAMIPISARAERSRRAVRAVHP
jgi:hypothetical protein